MTNIQKPREPVDELPRDARRSLLRSGLASVAALALGGVVAACSDDDRPSASARDAGSDDPSPNDAGSQPDGATTVGEDAGEASDADVAQLNALLGAEHSAIAAYTAGAGLIDAASADDALFALKDVILAIATDIRAQHEAHADALAAAIGELGGTPVDGAGVTFTPPDALVATPTILNVLKVAAAAERGAAVAYNKTVATLEAARSRFLAGAIEGDESQHFIVLTALIAGLVKPGAQLSTDTADEVIPEAFVSKVGAVSGLEAVPDYFA